MQRCAAFLLGSPQNDILWGKLAKQSREVAFIMLKTANGKAVDELNYMD